MAERLGQAVEGLLALSAPQPACARWMLTRRRTSACAAATGSAVVAGVLGVETAATWEAVAEGGAGLGSAEADGEAGRDDADGAGVTRVVPATTGAAPEAAVEGEVGCPPGVVEATA
ncbi:hypothetical protein ACFQZC_13095 [Streptacidiphilus monticola]